MKVLFEKQNLQEYMIFFEENYWLCSNDVNDLHSIAQTE
jgi:hypothetical protein